MILPIDKVITTMVIRPLDDPTRCTESVGADLNFLYKRLSYFVNFNDDVQL